MSLRSAEVVLLPSPLLGHAAWLPFAGALRRRGWVTRVCDLPDVIERPEDVRDHWLESLAPDAPTILVPHSNAGHYVPALWRHRRVVAAVFVDAALPPEAGVTTMVPPGLLEILEQMADAGGRLPPWTQWWDAAELADVLPDRVRQDVEPHQPRLPLAYFRASLEVPTGWHRLSGAYLGFRDTYAEERDRAARWGWSIGRLDGGHLHHLVDPEGVAAVVSRMLEELVP